MSAQDRAIQKLARELAGIKREVTSWRGPQLDYSSIENSGNFTFKDSDGNVTAVVGGQDDGSNTIRHVDGPTPPVPSGLSAHVDGPIVQVSWDGTFEDADTATYDWSHLEVIAVGPSNENLRGTISDATGASTNLAATSSGEWTVVARSVSRAEKRSLDGDAGTVDVKLVDIDGAIEAVQDSANGKNQVTYSEYPPTPSDPGIFDDTWFVGRVGRPNDVVEATNLVFNPSFEIAPSDLSLSSGLASAVQSTDTRGILKGSHCLSVTGASSGISATSAQIAAYTSHGVSAGEYLGWGWSLLDANAVGLTVSIGVNWYTSGGSFISSEYQPYRTVPTNLDMMSSAFLAPTGAYRARMIIRFRASGGSSPAPANFNVLTDGWLASPAASESAALAAVATYFDGDTESGATDNESHYRWTGTPHASTSEKYLPALTIGDSDTWNITEQYRHDGTGWVKVELSHYVFSSVDLGKATVGELDGIRIMGQTIRGEQLSGDAIDGKVITGGTYRTTGGTGSWSDDGLFIAQPDGTSMVRFPTDGSPLSLTASDVQIDRASITDLDMSYGSVRSGGEFTLASGVTAPASPPELTTGWSKFATLGAFSNRGYPPHAWESLGYWSAGDAWVRSVNIFGSSSSEPDKVEIFDYATGSFIRSFNIELNPTNNLTIIGDIVYLFGDVYSPSNVKSAWVYGYNLNTGVRTSRHEYTRGVQAKNALGNDGTNIIIASIFDNELWVHRRNPVTGVQVGSDMRSGANSWGGGTDLFGVRISGSEVTVLPRQTARIYTLSGTTLTRKPDTSNASGFAGWDNPSRNGAGMVWHDGSLGINVPHVVDSAGDVYEGTQFERDTNVSACFTWFNGTNETTPSPMLVSSFPARSNPRFSMPARAGMQKRLYFNFGSWNYVTLPEDLTTFSWMDVLDYGLSTGAPPATNTFPNADPATLKSTNNKFEVSGDGSGHWGPLTFNADGTMSSSAVPAWVPITSFLNSWAVGSFGFAPAYRVWPDGKVEWRGVVTGPAATTAKPIINIPVNARPSQYVPVGGSCNGSTGSPGWTRIDVNDPSAANAIRLNPQQGSVTWASLDTISYYKN